MPIRGHRQRVARASDGGNCTIASPFWFVKTYNSQELTANNHDPTTDTQQPTTNTQQTKIKN